MAGRLQERKLMQALLHNSGKKFKGYEIKICMIEITRGIKKGLQIITIFPQTKILAPVCKPINPQVGFLGRNPQNLWLMASDSGNRK